MFFILDFCKTSFLDNLLHDITFVLLITILEDSSIN